MVSVCKDDHGICRDAYVRVLPKPEGPEPCIPPYQKKGPFKTKLVAVPNLALFDSLDEQKEDKQKFIEESHKTNSTYKDQLFSSMSSRQQINVPTCRGVTQSAAEHSILSLKNSIFPGEVPVSQKMMAVKSISCVGSPFSFWFRMEPFRILYRIITLVKG